MDDQENENGFDGDLNKQHSINGNHNMEPIIGEDLENGPQLMSVEEEEEAISSSSSDDDDDEVQVFDFIVENVTEKVQAGEKVTSPRFESKNGWPWQIGVHFAGFKARDQISVYLEMADYDPRADQKNVLRRAKFKLDIFDADGVSLVSKKYPEYKETCGKSATNEFQFENGRDFGYQRMVPKRFFIDNLINKTNDTAIFRASVQPSLEGDSKKRTGMVGLLNQGATCYLNSLLQNLFHTRALRKAVYELDTTSDKAEEGVALELQHLFADLQTKTSPVGTQNLTKAFGWTDNQVFTQHDVQELLRELLDKLQDRMKGTPKESLIKDLFCGQFSTYVKCLNVNFESSRVEDFFDLQLDVQGLNSVQDSFKKYIQEERLDGENQYEAEGYGKQDAIKGVKFLKFPPVLHLHLKRFAYNFSDDRTFKIHDRYEFPEKLCLNEFMKEGASSEDYTYRLHSVLVHSGNDSRGHYYAFVYLNDEKHPKGKWFQFNDENVVKVKRRMAISDTFGVGSGEARLKNKRLRSSIDSNASAYMLVYIRESMWDQIMCKVDTVPPQLLQKFEDDARNKINAKEELERSKNRGYVKVATLKDVEKFDKFAPQTVRDDWVDWSEVKEIEYGDVRFATEHDVYSACEKEFKLEKGKFRLWTTCTRQNDTVRLDEVLEDTPESFSQKLKKLLFLEQGDIVPLQPKEVSLLFREYDSKIPGIVKGSAYFIASTGLILNSSHVSDIWTVLAEKVLRLPKEEVLEKYDLFELLTLNPADKEQVRKIEYSEEVTLADVSRAGVFFNLEPSGDILIFSRKNEHPDCVEYFDKIMHSVTITFKDISQQLRIESFDVVLDERISLEQALIESSLSEKLSLASKMFRITLPDINNPKKPSRLPLSESDYQSSISFFFNKRWRKSLNPTVIYYETLPCAREELKNKIQFRFVTHSPRGGENVHVIGNGKGKSSTTSATTTTRWDQPIVTRLFINKQYPVLFSTILAEVENRLPQNLQFFLYVVANCRIDRVYFENDQEVDENLITRCLPGMQHALLTEDLQMARVPEIKHEPKFYGEYVALPPEITDRRILVSVYHCTLRDETAIPMEIGLPSVTYIFENDTLGSFWKRLIRRLNVPQDVLNTWRPFIYASSKVICLDVKAAEVVVPTQTAATTIIAPIPIHPGANGSPIVRKPKISQEEYDSIPLWNRPEYEPYHDSSNITLCPIVFYVRHPTNIGRSGSPIQSLTIRSS